MLDTTGYTQGKGDNVGREFLSISGCRRQESDLLMERGKERERKMTGSRYVKCVFLYYRDGCVSIGGMDGEGMDGSNPIS